MNMEEMTKNVQKLEELDLLIEQAREEADVKYPSKFLLCIVFCVS